ncbi:Os04g0404601, partial [Oryza sativa Japonica Group]
DEGSGDAAVGALGEEPAGLGGVAGAVHDAEDLLGRAVVGEREAVAGDDVAHGLPLRPLPRRHHQPLVLDPLPPQHVPQLGDVRRELRHPDAVARHPRQPVLVQQRPDHRVLRRLHAQQPRHQLHVHAVGEEPGVGADVAGEADVGDDVGGEEEVEAVLVGVEGRVQRRVHRRLHDLAEVRRADVQQRPREPLHVLLDLPAGTWPTSW